MAQICLATLDDLPAVASLLYDAFIEFRSSYTDEGFAATTPTSEQLLQRLKEGPIWLVRSGDVLLGTVSAVSRHDDVYVRGMAVSPPARGLGLGQLLLNAVEEFALTQGHKRLVLSTTPFLSAAIRLYEHWGFRRVTDGPHDLHGTPLFTMVKHLP
jgi:GNAT superfamily N-acetyltransferase